MTGSARSFDEVSRIAATAALILSALFLAILILLHFLKPEINPSWRMISEYELGQYGRMMRVDFFLWAASVVALMIALWTRLRARTGILGKSWMLLISLALLGAGIFVTNAITDRTANVSNDFHTICGAVVILTFPIAASLVAACLGQNEATSKRRFNLLAMTLLPWLGFIVFLGSDVLFGIITHDSRAGPQVLVGWPNRFMVVTYNVWLIAAATQAIRRSKAK